MSRVSNSASYDEELQAEQIYVDGLFHRLDQEVTTAQQHLNQVMLEVDPANPDAEALVRRETEYHSLNAKIDRLNLAQLGLVFGRVDVETANPELIDNPVAGNPKLDRRYIGRMGLDDRNDDYRTLLLDWRAPMARPFYLATTAQPEGVHTRRHIRTQGTTVTAINDEILHADATTNTTSLGIGDESALLQALNAARTGHMNSIVETIQREQDEIIRDNTRGVMVVEGGPGTGKTAVALHRIAYLLYTWRKQLTNTGVLIVGPNNTFLNYISRVLPELGETGVVLSTIGELFPGIQPTHTDSLLTQEIKGSIEMVTILKRLVNHYQSLPTQSETILIDGLELTIDASLIKSARTRARRSRRPHNMAQPIFKDQLAELLAQHMVQLIGADPLGGHNLLSAADIAQLHDDLLEDPTVDKLVERFWPLLDPTEVLHNFLHDNQLITTIAYDYDEETQSALFRDSDTGWTSSDTALIDELAVLIGLLDPEEERKQAEQKWREQLASAEDVLDVLSSSGNTDLDDDSVDAEVLSAFDVIDAEHLARRQESRDHRSTAQRARADYTWVYGHIIIDEAQELTPMQWRMIMRRSPSRWMTIVGDISQTSSPAGVDSWAETLSPFVGTRFRTHQLTVNYRTTAQIMEVANSVLARFAPETIPSTTVRTDGSPVHYYPYDTDPEKLAEHLQAKSPERLHMIIGPDSAENATIRGISSVKGLEFDQVILIQPELMVAESPQGWQNLFVALTRATQQLHIIGEMP
ncbi:HelD family protein [Corynebacterium kutscheri]|uniref:HelD family protein n=1 Tax=Corynebacterium kutscheri TaxID=35755 RepID=UPI0037C03A23